MSTLNLSLPPVMKAFVEAQVRSGHYSSASDYVRTLIRADQYRDTGAPIEAARLDGLARAECAAGLAVCAWLRTRRCHGSPAEHDTNG
jgi:antitoxin ParD1/3/4